MSLIKCDECRNQFSDKAKSCPKCGAPLQRRRSKAGILFVFLILIVWLGMQVAPSKKSNQVAISVETKQPKQNVITKSLETPTEVSHIDPKWQIALDVNEMSGKRTHLTSSSSVEPIKRMTFPYESITAKIVVSCHKRENSVYIEFSDSPNLANENIRSGYAAVVTKIKWDSKIEEVELLQYSGQRRLYFYGDEAHDAIKRLSRTRKFMIELQWHRQDPTYFDFNLDGASDAIKQIQLQCWRET